METEGDGILQFPGVISPLEIKYRLFSSHSKSRRRIAIIGNVYLIE